jgi:transcriptional regulator with XRE-family HTH domain
MAPLGRPRFRYGTNPFAVWLRGLLDRNDITMPEIATVTGFSRKTVSKWLAGREPYAPVQIRMQIEQYIAVKQRGREVNLLMVVEQIQAVRNAVVLLTDLMRERLPAPEDPEAKPKENGARRPEDFVLRGR